MSTTATAPARLGEPLAPMTVHERAIFAHITTTGAGFKALALGLAVVSAWAFFAWIWQLTHGLGVTGLLRPTYWGIYITNFVFFIGVSHAGTLISAILRLSKAEWRRSITRMAEVITVLVIGFGAGNVIVDLGHSERALYVFRHANFTSPLLWDICSISVYLTASTVYLILPMLPDLVRLEQKVGGWRRSVYQTLLRATGYRDTPEQRHRLERVLGVMMVMVLPIAISVHTVVSWVFAMTIQPMWHSTIFGPYFVAGAIFSGIAAILTFMVILRRAYHLEAYLRPIHFDHLGKLFLVMTLFWLYFTFAEYLTTYYGGEQHELRVFFDKVTGRFALPFWVMVVTCFVIPFAILCRSRGRRSEWGILFASLSVNVGMYLERYTIVVPSLTNARIQMTDARYSPSWVEWSILAGCVSTFLLLYLGFTKLFPIISVWEVEEGIEHGPRETTERLATYYPPVPAVEEAP
jgi:molybdopterin-containing oxidoreductase family membrane subunit